MGVNVSGATMPLVAHSANGDSQWHLLADHLHGTAEKAGSFAASFDSCEIGHLVGLVHDIGKADPSWQTYLRSVAGGLPHPTVDHKHAGMFLARDAGLGTLLAPVIAGHHGGMPWVRDLDSDLAGGPTPGQAKAIQAAPTLGIRVRDLRQSVPEFALPKRGDAASVRATEFWARMVFSALVDADHLDTEAHFEPQRAAQRGKPTTSMPDLLARFDRLVSAAIGDRSEDPFAEARTALRQAVEHKATAPPGWFELTAPTGSGKTLAALSFALRHAIANGLRRVVTAVPFISVTEQVAAAYRGALGADDDFDVLEHHSAVGQATDSGQVGDELATRLASENWDASIVVTTTVQLLESLFDNRPSRCRKLHRLAGSVIILDEVQAMPWRVLEPTLEVLRTLVSDYGASVVLTTATQPPLHLVPTAKQIARSVLAPRTASVRDVRVRVDARAGGMHSDDLPAALADIARMHGGQCLAVVNSVADARQLARSLSGVEGLHHLSTRLCMAHRRDVLDRVRYELDSGLPCLLVSTQLIEAGVDLDFPAGFRAVAPLTSLIQTAGRINRHGRRATGLLRVEEIVDGRMPPEEYAIGAKLTLGLIHDKRDLLSDGTLAEYYERFLTYTRDKLDHFDVQAARETFNYPEVARRYRVIVDDTTGVLVPYGAFDPARERPPADPGPRRQWVRDVQPFLVSLRDRELRHAIETGSVEPLGSGIWRWTGDYDPLTGLVSDTSTEGSIW